MTKSALSPHIASVQQIDLQILEQKNVITESVVLDELTADERIRLLNMLSLGIDAMTALRNRVRGVTPTDELVKVDAKDRVRRKTVAKGIKGEREFLKPLASAYKPRKPLIKVEGKPVAVGIKGERESLKPLASSEKKGWQYMKPIKAEGKPVSQIVIEDRR